MRNIFNIIWLVLIVVGGCASDNKQPAATESASPTVQDDGADDGGTTSGTPENQATDDGRRPIEDSEGIPGYLHDPSKLAVVPAETETDLKVTAPVEETNDDNIKPRAGLTLSSYSVKMIDLLEAIESDAETVAATLLESAPITDAGFNLDFPDPYPNVILITTATVGDGTSIKLESNIETDVTYSQSLEAGNQSFIELAEITAIDIKKRFIKQADVNNDDCFTSSDLVQLLQDCAIDEPPPPDKRYCDLNGDGLFTESDFNTPENLVVYEVCAADL